MIERHRVSRMRENDFRWRRALATAGCALLGTLALTASGSGATEGGGPVFTAAATGGGAGAGTGAALNVSAAATCTAGTDSDFNGDGVRDTVLANPAGNLRKGEVTVVYGGTGTVQTLNQDNARTGYSGEPGDQFGYATDTVDWNGDGCTDLVVSAPFEASATAPDVGCVSVVLGSPAGLAAAANSLSWAQGTAGFADSGEAGDRFGFALAAAKNSANQPYIVIGVPGEDLESNADAGMFHVVRGTTNVALWSGKGVPGGIERDDQIGYAVDASTYHFAVGQPGEAIGNAYFAGGTGVFSSTALVDGLPKLAANLNQEATVTAGTEVSGTAEIGDQMGKAVAVAPYRAPGSTAVTATSMVAVGVPFDTVNGKDDAGSVHRFIVTDTGFSELAPLHQDAGALAGGCEPGDYFGAGLELVNTNPAAAVTESTLLLAIGVPGEDLGPAGEAGMTQTVPAVTAAPSWDVAIERGKLLATPAIAGETVGANLGANQTHLFIGTPLGSNQVYAVPWTSIAAKAPTLAATYAPGVNGLPADDTLFGWSL